MGRQLEGEPWLPSFCVDGERLLCQGPGFIRTQTRQVRYMVRDDETPAGGNPARFVNAARQTDQCDETWSGRSLMPHARTLVCVSRAQIYVRNACLSLVQLSMYIHVYIYIYDCMLYIYIYMYIYIYKHFAVLMC